MCSEKKVLIIAYNFPPENSAMALQVFRRLKHLSTFGWNPTLLTRSLNGPIAAEGFPAHGKSEIRTIRIKGFDYVASYTFLKRFHLHKLLSLFIKLFAIPDDRIFWARKVYCYFKKHLAKENFDIVYSVFRPGSSVLAGKWISFLIKKPLIIDFFDEWASNPYNKTNIFDMIKQPVYALYENKCVRTASAIIVSNECVRKLFLSRYPEEPPSKFVIIPNTYDEDEKFNTNIFNVCSYKRMKVFALGSFYEYRSPRPFLESLAKMADKDLVELTFAGYNGEKDIINFIKSSSLSGSVKFASPITRKGILRALASADLLLLMVPSYPGAERENPSKLIEYLSSGRPILALAPVNSIPHKIIKDTGSGYFADISDSTAVCDTLKHLIALWKEGSLKTHRKEDEIAKYSSLRAAEQVVAVLDGVCANEPKNGKY